VITMPELLKGKKLEDQTEKVKYNLSVLLDRLNLVRAKRGLPMVITNALRDMMDAIRIYMSLAKQRGIKYHESQIKMGSQHFLGAAADVLDLDGSLYQWCLDNIAFLAEVGLWIEIKDDQPRVHFQIFPPRSGKRIFNP